MITRTLSFVACLYLMLTVSLMAQTNNQQKRVDEAAALARQVMEMAYNDSVAQSHIKRLTILEEQTNNETIRFYYSMLLAHRQNVKGQFKEAKENVDEALTIVEQIKRPEAAINDRQKFSRIDLISLHRLAADVYRNNGLTARALELYTNLLDLYLEAPERSQLLSRRDSMVLSQTYVQMASLISLRKDSSATDYLEKSLEYIPPRGERELASIYYNAALVYRRLKLYDQSLQVAFLAYEYVPDRENSSLTTATLTLISSVYLQQGQTDKAMTYAQKSLDYPANAVRRAITLHTIGKLHQQKGQYNQAESMYKAVFDTAVKYDTKELAVNAKLKLSELYAEKKDSGQAYLSLEQHIVYKDEVIEKRNDQKLNEVKTKYETREKEQEIKDLTQQQRIMKLESEAAIGQLEKQRLVLGLALLAPISLLIAAGWYINRRRLQTRLETEKQQRLRQLAELKVLRSQMNPHFIFNALNSIQHFVWLNDAEEAGYYLDRFTVLMRGMLNLSEKEYVTLAEEWPLLQSYIELEALLLEGSFEYKMEAANDINMEDILLPPLLIQPYIENAFKHGLAHQTGTRKLEVLFAKQNNALTITIEDNGIGRAAAQQKKERREQNYQSFAREATAKRTELIGHQNKMQISIDTKDLVTPDGQAAGTKVVLIIVNG